MDLLSRASRLVPLALVLAASGCSYVHTIPLDGSPLGSGALPPADLYKVEWWKQLVTETPLLEYAPREPAQPAVDAVGHRVAVVTRDGAIRALTSAGLELWTYRTHGPFFSTGVFRDGVLYVPGGDGILYALEEDTGKKLWEYDAGEELVSNVALAGKLALVMSQTNTLFAVDAKSGKWAWQYRRDMPSGFSIHGAATPVVRGDTVYAGFADGHLVALGLQDGSLRWDRDLSQSSQFADVDATPLFDADGNLYVAAYRGGLFSLEPLTGDTRWHVDAPGFTGLALAGRMLVATGDERVAGFSISHGEPIWTRDVGHRAAFSPAVAGRYLLVPTAKSLLFLDVVTGRPIQSFDPGRGVTATPAVVGRSVYVLSNQGFLYAFRMNARGG